MQNTVRLKVTKPSDFCKENLKLFDVKSTKFVEDYFSK